MKKNEIINEIISGTLDNKLDNVDEAIKERRKSLAKIFKINLSIGDKVKFNNTVRPKYLQGCKATLISKKQKNVVVELDEPIGRYSGKITTPPTLLERV